MELQLQLVCPACESSQLYNFIDLAPGQIRRCTHCHSPLHLTTESLERFRRDVRIYCES